MFTALITLIIALLDGAAHVVLNFVSQLSQGEDVLRGMLSYDVQGYFVCQMFRPLITFIIAVRDGEAHKVLDGISMWRFIYSVCRRNVSMELILTILSEAQS